MPKKRIYELAKELNLPSKKILTAAQSKGYDVKNHMSGLDAAEEKMVKAMLNSNHKVAAKKTTAKPAGAKSTHINSGNHHTTTASQNRTNSAKPSNNNHVNSNQQGNHSNTNHSASKTQHSNNSHNNNAQRNSGKPQQTTSKTQTHGKSTSTTQTRSTNSGSGKFGGSLNNRNNKKKRRNNRKGRNPFASMYSKNQRIRQNKKKGPSVRKDRPLPEVLTYEDGMNAQDLGKLLHREPAEIIKKLFMLGMMVNQNQSLDKDTIEVLAEDYGIKAEEKKHVDVSDIDKFFEEAENNTAYEAPRPPVVTIMGHVDHGKTTLLDYLRHSHITSGEAGGITQAIGAYQLHLDGKDITFLDTPGHAAFTEMRARGANITDITILVVAADDGVMPQTVEAIDHAKAAGTPIIVAVNKIDKAGANPNHVKEQLMGYGLVPEDYGGDTIFVDISAKNGTNVDDLLNMVLLQADVMELKANPKQNGAGSVVEARLDRGKGPVATLLVQQGTLHKGDPIVVGDTFGRVRTMTNELGQEIESATPSTPVEITGLNDVPEAGDRFIVFNDEKTARAAGEERAKEAQMEERKQNNRAIVKSGGKKWKKQW